MDKERAVVDFTPEAHWAWAFNNSGIDATIQYSWEATPDWKTGLPKNFNQRMQSEIEKNV